MKFCGNYRLALFGKTILPHNVRIYTSGIKLSFLSATACKYNPSIAIIIASDIMVNKKP